MKTAAELYPSYAKEEAEQGSFYGPGDYQPILDELGNIVLQVDDDDYQGDSRVLYKNKDGQYGLLIFGWGSCSGCDALQVCDKLADIQSLMDELTDKVKWFPSAEECLSYFNEHDWEGDYGWSQEKTKEFVTSAKALLKDWF